MSYDYQVQTIGGSSFDNLEQVGDNLQQAFVNKDTLSLLAQGWELWQVTVLQASEVNGLILVYRRPKA